MQRARAITLATLGALSTSCSPTDDTVASPIDVLDLASMIGTWRWMLHTTTAPTRAEDGSKIGGASTVEDEQWQFRPGPTATQLLGRYVRTVEVRADNRVPFTCNQRLWYRQRAVFDVVASTNADGSIAITETGYRAEPSPCDHGFRHIGAYTAHMAGGLLELHWEGGTQTLMHLSSDTPEPAADPWLPPDPTGMWRWTATSRDEAGNATDETEWWQVTRRSETQLDATYRRRVTVRSVDGSTIACAGGPSWTFDDTYVLDAEREDEHWHFHERAVDPGDHPCLRTSPQRALDEATGDVEDGSFVLEWRGKRRQVLYRAGL